jgi:phage terminase Nu1 subunit (DNA packaging protein)
MSQYSELSHVELEQLHRELMRRYEDWKGRGLSLDMSRGKPAGDQFDLINDMLDTLNSKSSLKSADGSDCRNTGF